MFEKLFDEIEDTERKPARPKLRDYRNSDVFRSYREQAARTKREESFDD